MKTLSTKFSDYRDRLGIERRYILKLTDGITTWYFSNVPTVITQGTCYPLLSGGFSIKEGFDVFSRRWVTPTCNLTINNAPMELQDDGSWLRVTDVIGNIRYQDAILYASIGADMTTTADMLVVVDGIIENAPEGTEDKVTVEITDRARTYNVRLPRNTVQDIEDDTSFGIYDSQLPLTIPLSWGIFVGESDTVTPTGCAVGVCISDSGNVAGRWCLGDHSWTTVDDSDIFFKFDQFPSLSQYIGGGTTYPTGGGDMGDRAYFVPTTCIIPPAGGGSNLKLRTKLRPIGRNSGTYDFTLDYDVVTHFDRMIDGDPLSYGSVLDYADPFNTNGMEGRALFTWDDYYTPTTGIDQVVGSFIGYNAGDITFELLYKTPAAWGSSFLIAYLYYGVTAGDDVKTSLGAYSGHTAVTLESFPFASGTEPIDWTAALWNFIAGVQPQDEGAYWPLMVRLQLVTDDAQGPPIHDHVALNQILMDIHDIRWSIVHYLPVETIHMVYDASAIGWRNAERITVTQLRPIYIQGSARPYGSWITGRSSNYTAGTVIEDPAGIVESLLRDVLAVPTAQIDAPSFITAENTNVKARISLHDGNTIDAYDVIKMMGEQSTAAFYPAATGKWRAADLSDKTPTTTRTILYCDNYPGTLTISKTDDLVNHLLVNSRWREEYGDYQTYDIIEDATSQSAIGKTLSYEARWPNIAGATKDYVAAWLVNTTDGIWSKEHTVIDMSLIGWKHIDLDCGDTIELDAASFDPHMLCQGVSWSGLQFMVTNITYKQDRIIISAVALYA
jgi:hypothetical protein